MFLKFICTSSYFQYFSFILTKIFTRKTNARATDTPRNLRDERTKECESKTYPILQRFLASRYHRKPIGTFHAIVVIDEVILQTTGNLNLLSVIILQFSTIAIKVYRLFNYSACLCNPVTAIYQRIFLSISTILYFDFTRTFRD